MNKSKPDQSKIEIAATQVASLDLRSESISSPCLSTLVETTESVEAKLAKTEINAATAIPVPAKRGPKAGKPRDIKKPPKPIPTATRRTYRNRTTSQEQDIATSNIPRDVSPTLPTSLVTTHILGNLRFKCVKNEFKCIECGETDLRTHYKNDYTCHQCLYNTNCSKSFEFHLHGHLDKKRVALWNKPVKTDAEVYKCPCGFRINAALDNGSDANTGNKVAAHLLQCEYKYCKFSMSEIKPAPSAIVETSSDNLILALAKDLTEDVQK